MITYKPGFIPTTFILVGAGGTGSRVLPLLAQFLKTAAWITNPRIIVIDHDVVEDKNLVRQNFIKPDVGRPKALVLAERYGRAFDINIIPITEKIDSTTDCQIMVSNTEILYRAHLINTIIIMAVDSVEARRSIISNFLCTENSTRNLFIDAGNGDDFGQVQLFNANAIVMTNSRDEVFKYCTLDGKLMPVDVDIPCLPIPINFYNGLMDKAEKSCADLDQSLAINASMATAIISIIQSFVYSKSIPFHRLNISLLNGSTPEYITLDYLCKIAKEKMSFSNFYRCPAPSIINMDGVISSIYNKLEEFKKKMNIKEEKPKKDKEKDEQEKVNLGEELKKVLKSKLVA